MESSLAKVPDAETSAVLSVTVAVVGKTASVQLSFTPFTLPGALVIFRFTMLITCFMLAKALMVVLVAVAAPAPTIKLLPMAPPTVYICGLGRVKRVVAVAGLSPPVTVYGVEL